jgi:uncharacterized membrane protein YGL010W
LEGSEEWQVTSDEQEEVLILPLVTVSGGFMAESFMESYRAKHRHPLNRLTHSIGIPMIVLSLPLIFFNWRWALLLSVAGWALQFLGHFIEGNQPAFFRNPIYLIVGPLWLLRRALGAVLGIVKPHK